MKNMFNLPFKFENNPGTYDIKLLDISKDNLAIEISELLKQTYLSDCRDERSDSVHGKMYGPHHRLMISLPTNYKRYHKNIFYLVDPNSPYTFLTDEVMTKLGVEHKIPSSGVYLEINQKPTRAFISTGHFRDVNVIGTNFLDGLKLHINYLYPYGFELEFPQHNQASSQQAQLSQQYPQQQQTQQPPMQPYAQQQQQQQPQQSQPLQPQHQQQYPYSYSGSQQQQPPQQQQPQQSQQYAQQPLSQDNSYYPKEQKHEFDDHQQQQMPPTHYSP
ncbi:hypothetical protein PPL_09591 [Heterostelium album PN500]|uniref:Uncharacterized protein n=1 Tax=Heterostelium pallidum (strain ATCC 26659 / Pp 5 / PN500) TaxID=670386 RepID=D3BNS0_HETP5|nr:hypothetical protein PPL_09591 [Heterostelium album PN500]EFA76839.1 hypothetical protein PPL_09591 [Heterostelium album PN500]|eukprot:XP_020428971.1 hypothetical protein PPL_09591 [Heterostelium album PN500]